MRTRLRRTLRGGRSGRDLHRRPARRAPSDPTGAHRVRVAGTKIGLIGVGPVDDRSFVGTTEMQTLFVDAHTWALATLTSLTLVAGAEPTVGATGPFAMPAALFVIKLHASQDRRPTNRPEKRSSDALDLYRLMLQFEAEGSLRSALSTGPAPLRRAVRVAVQKVLIDDAARTRGWLSASDDQTGQVTADELRYLAEPVVDAESRTLSGVLAQAR